MSKSEQTKAAMSEELALIELEGFVNKWVKRPPSRIKLGEKYEEKLKDSYPETLDALMSGRLVLDADKVPVYTLIEPLKYESGEVYKTTVEFKTRIKPTTKADLGYGIDLNKELPKYAMILLAHVAGLASVKELDNFGKNDYDVVAEVSGLFQ